MKAVPAPEVPNEAALLPDRHPQKELFLCDISDAKLKDDMASMEHPFFTLSKKPDMGVRVYEHNGNRLEIAPSHLGMATIYDKDILIYAISQLIAGKNRGRPLRQEIRISARDLLIFTNRHTGGRDYELLDNALKRLTGTRIKTDIKTGGTIETSYFAFVDSAYLERDRKTNKVIEMRIKLSDWVFRSVEAAEVLTLHPDYFRLRKPLERRIYELARKHCGRQPRWDISVVLLKKKTGSTAAMKKFRELLRQIVANQHLPDYWVELDGDMVRFTLQNEEDLAALPSSSPSLIGSITLKSETYEEAATISGGWCKYFLESEWRDFMHRKGARPDHPDQAYLGFVRAYVKRHGSAR